MPHRYVSRVVDRLPDDINQIHGMTVDEARRRVLGGNAEAVRAIDGSFALVAHEGVTVRMARSLDRPMRYFLAKRHEGPALYVADRIDTLHEALEADGLAGQFHPSYTRMVPAHYVVEIALVGCPDPDPIYTRFFTPARNALPTSLDEVGERYIGAVAAEVEKWLRTIDASSPRPEPIGVAFSGGIDSGAVFLVVYHVMLKLGLSPARLKAFVLNLGGGPDLDQARAFLSTLGLSMFLEEIDAAPARLDVGETLRVLEDYKPLDVECAAMGLELCRGIRARYPDWRHLADGDGGDENLKDYPIEENAELTIRSVVDNLMLYHEGWGVGRIKHSLTYSGGLSRSYVRTYAPMRRYGFAGSLTGYDVPTLYSLKGEIVRRGVKTVTGLDMPVYPKRRFQHGALPADAMRIRLGGDERTYRRAFHDLYA
jgi:asparagine synthase (glutamine-hydrolysing)